MVKDSNNNHTTHTKLEESRISISNSSYNLSPNSSPNYLSNSLSNLVFDVVYANGAENEFIKKAALLGYTHIVLLTTNPNYVAPKSEKILIKKAYLLKEVSEIARLRNKFDYLFAPAERRFFEQRVDFIINAELSSLKDSFHYRSTSLNQVHAELARKNGITIVFGFNNLLMTRVYKLDNISSNTSSNYKNSIQSILGKMYQNAILVRKYRLKNASFSMASDPSMMRSKNILTSLISVLSIE
jgi:RNase P/RNase MRP subunit p30